MNIRIVRTQNSRLGHVLLYAEPIDKKDCFYLNDLKIKKIKLDFTRPRISEFSYSYKEAIILNPEIEKDNNVTHSIRLSSEVSFEVFYHKINKWYSTNKNYSLFFNNCVDSVCYALRKAKLPVDISLPYYKKSTKYCCFFGRPIVTSYDLVASLFDNYIYEKKQSRMQLT